MQITSLGVRRFRFVAASTATRFLRFSAIALTAIVYSGMGASITVAAPAFPVFDSTADPQSVLDYWTTGRMESARPSTSPGTASGPSVKPVAAGVTNPVHQTDILSPTEVAQHPHTSIGKIFFTLNGFDYVCSASAVTSEGRWGEGSGQLVMTAGHCVNNGFGTFASNFVFAPGYSDGVAPLGLWAAERLYTTNQWHTGSGAALARDVGFAKVVGTGAYAGLKLHDVVDALDIAFTESYPEDGLDLHVEPTTGITIASFGYGVLNFGGESQVRSVAQVDALDPFFSPATLGLPSTHTGGSSGGPWLYNYSPDSLGPGLNVVTGVNSYVYGGTDRMYSPQLDGLIHDLWAFVETPIPEPSSLPFLILSGIALAARRRAA